MGPYRTPAQTMSSLYAAEAKKRGAYRRVLRGIHRAQLVMPGRVRRRDVQRLSDQFPEVSRSVIKRIAHNKLHPMELSTLDPEQKSLCSYRDLESFLRPLGVYFAILRALATTSGNAKATVTRVIGDVEFKYVQHITALAEKYEWLKVLAYHMQFHRERQVDMVRGDYSRWAVVDKDLKYRHLVGSELMTEKRAKRCGVVF
ncbi:hypothetical protein C8R43DRAFT_979440 [Mycena crocata]|nr:hypothetical protein C8R43DRAFT_979440 [Mycena crocata]